MWKPEPEPHSLGMTQMLLVINDEAWTKAIHERYITDGNFESERHSSQSLEHRKRKMQKGRKASLALSDCVR